MNYITHPDCEVKHEAVFAHVCGYCKSIKRIIEQDKRIAELEDSLRQNDEERYRYKVALREIVDQHYVYYHDHIVDGHRCAEEIARKVLGPKEE